VKQDMNDSQQQTGKTAMELRFYVKGNSFYADKKQQINQQPFDTRRLFAII
jgi:hypothetical protein